jgi:histidinol-phosphate aminotransferase
MTAAFDWGAHVRQETLAVAIPRHRQYGSKLVAANNELIHPLVETLFARFCNELDPERVRHYPDHRPVIERLARVLGRPAEQVLLASSADSAIHILLASVGGTCGRLILQWPNYSGYETYAGLYGIEIVRVATIGLSVGAAEARLAQAMHDAAPALVVVTNPGGIDGSALPVAAVGRLAAAALAGRHVLLVDEAYLGFSPIDHIGLLACYPNLVLVRSFSKAMGLAGLRIAAVLTGDAFLAGYLQRWCPDHSVSVIAAQFLLFCLDRLREIDEARAEIVACREWIESRAAALLPDWHVPASAANFVYLGAPDAVANEALACAFEDAGIAVRDVSRYVRPRHAVRVTVGHWPVSERIVAVIGAHVGRVTARTRTCA